MDMIKGSTCKLIMQLWTEFKNADKVISLMMLPNPLAGTQWEDTEDQDTNMDAESEEDDDDGGHVDTIKWHLAKDDVEAIIEHCGHAELTGDKPMLVDIQQWQSYAPDKWWTVDDKVAGRDDPIKSGEEGFWSKVRSLMPCLRRWLLTSVQIESKKNRDWERWPSRSIGPLEQGRKKIDPDAGDGELEWDEGF
jgi:hypothetical protein